MSCTLRFYCSLFVTITGVLAFTPAAYPAASIFSGLGYGVFENLGSSRAFAMGNAALALQDSIAFNFLNPAVLAEIRQTRISAGAYATRHWMQDRQSSDVDDWAQVEFFSIAIKLKEGLGLGFSLTPYTRVDYRYGWDYSLSNVAYYESYQGNGGLSQAALNLAWSAAEPVKIGASVSGIWGQVEELRGSYADASGYQDLEFLYSKRWLAFGGTVGLLLEPRRGLTIGAALSPEVPIQLDRTFSYTGEDSSGFSEAEYRLAARYGLGAALQLSKRWLAAGQVFYSPWGDLKDLPGDSVQSQKYQDSYDVSLGAEWIPGAWNSERFLQRLQYRFGARWESAYTLSQGNPVNAYFATAGFGLPFNEGRDRFDLSFEFGLRGDLTQNGGQEKLLKIHLGLNLGETWFKRAKPSWED